MVPLSREAGDHTLDLLVLARKFSHVVELGLAALAIESEVQVLMGPCQVVEEVDELTCLGDQHVCSACCACLPRPFPHL